MHARHLLIPCALAFVASTARAQNHMIFISGNVQTGQLWHAATSAGNGTSGSCSVGANDVEYYSAPFFTDQTADSYSLSLYYESFQSGFVYLYQDQFDPQDPCDGIIAFGFAPLANITNIHLDANRQYVFVTSEDTLHGGGGSFQVTIDGPMSCHMFLGNIPSPHHPFCFGDGSGSACPCGNESPAGGQAGCLNSVAQGGKLIATGDASVASDTLVLFGSQMPNTPVLYIQGAGDVAGGNGSVFGDGLRCVRGALVRLGIETNSGGASHYPTPGQASVSMRGHVPPSGGDFVYQCWYRDPAPAFCTTATFNLTNGVRVHWLP